MDAGEVFWTLAPRARRQLGEKGWLDLDGVFEVLEVLEYEERGRRVLGLKVPDVRFDPWDRYRYPALAPGLRRLAARMLEAGVKVEVAKEACRRFEEAWLEKLRPG